MFTLWSMPRLQLLYIRRRLTCVWVELKTTHPTALSYEPRTAAEHEDENEYGDCSNDTNQQTAAQSAVFRRHAAADAAHASDHADRDRCLVSAIRRFAHIQDRHTQLLQPSRHRQDYPKKQTPLQIINNSY